jgi:ABC-type transport system substrate-binding protein
MNLAMPPFDDLHVRRAVAFSVNSRELVRDVRAFASSGSTGATGRPARHIAPDATEADLLAGFDPFPGKQGPERRAKARWEMALSRYDVDGDGRCDDHACDGVALYAFDSPAGRAIAETLRLDLHPIGIDVDVRIQGAEIASIFTGETHAPLYATWAWLADYPNASTFFLPLLSAQAIHLHSNRNLSMLGGSSTMLRALGYDVTAVPPSIDDRIDACVVLSGDEQTTCWALLDKFVMTKIVPWVPFFTQTYVAVGSLRVRGVVPDPLSLTPALDQIWLADAEDVASSSASGG